MGSRIGHIERIPRLARRSEAGDSLVEVLVALVIIGLTATALLGALATSLSGSAEHRSFASIDNVLKSYAETAKYKIELQPQTAAWFVDCAPWTSSSYNGNTLPPPSLLPSGYTVALQGVQYWNGSTFDAIGAPCGASDHTGYQQLSFSATADNGFTQTLVVAVRKAAG